MFCFFQNLRNAFSIFVTKWPNNSSIVIQLMIWNHVHDESFSQQKRATYAACMKKRNSNQHYGSHIKREKLIIFFSKKNDAKHWPPSNFYHVEFKLNYLIEYS